MSSYVFTVTAGRTGTAWLSDLIRLNSSMVSVHEPLAIDDFGNQMPDIRTLRSFNERGMTPFVEAFWQRKFAGLQGLPGYAETNHTLAKCGLVEFLADRGSDDEIYLLCVRRDWDRLCLSYVNRGDFRNVTINWQWYLDHRYRQRIIDPAPIVGRHGYLGQIIWYIAEIEARQAYYATLYGDRFHFIECAMEAIVTPEGAGRLLRELGLPADTPRMPPRRNQNRVETNPEWLAHIRKTLAGIAIDPGEHARRYIEQGRRLAVAGGGPATGRG